MRTVDKLDFPECLNEYKESMNWSDLSTECKNEIARRCFDEQNGLCVYCERQLIYPDWQSIAHCEHLIPRHTKTRIFDYSNICLSCNGTPPQESPEFLAYGEHKNSSCGRSRENKRWEPDLYLHPVDMENIELRFSWDLFKHKIKERNQDDVRAVHMIELLNLNNPYLLSARNKARGVFRKVLNNEFDVDNVLLLLSEHELEFSSYLKATYKAA